MPNWECDMITFKNPGKVQAMKKLRKISMFSRYRVANLYIKY